MKSDLVDIECVYIYETPAAILIKPDEGSDKKIWLPKSLIEYERKGKLVVITGPAPFLTDKGLT